MVISVDNCDAVTRDEKNSIFNEAGAKHKVPFQNSVVINFTSGKHDE